MRVIHGIWAHGALCLWAEDPDLPRRVAGSAPPASGCRGRIRSRARPPSWPTCWPGWPGARRRGRRRGPQGRPRRADPAAALGRRRAAGLAGLVRPEPSGSDGPAALRAGQARAGLAGQLAGAGARLRARGRARRAPWRARPAGRPRGRGRVAALPGRGGPLRRRPGRARPGAAGARGRGRATPPGGARCSAAPTRSGPVTWPRRCPRPAGRADGEAPGTLLAGALDALADAAVRARLPGLAAARQARPRPRRAFRWPNDT